jgi:exopolyphosphatase/guanosine-5'-triphosphate,3'-diphosphate pyrophosphatase
VTRVAAIDLGTNTTRLLVADVVDGELAQVVRRTAITRLGEGVDARRRLLPAPIARVRNVLVEYRREAETLGAERTLLVATSAVRDAENGEAFLGELEWSYGFATRLLSGNEEAALTLRGVGALEPGAVVLDVGGGSTELIGETVHTSLDVGSVRLTERFLHGDPPTAEELDACAAHVRSVLPAVEVASLVGVAGTVTTLVALEENGYDPAVTHGYRLRREQIERQCDRLAAATVEERRGVAGLEPERAPVIVGGVLVVREVLRRYDLDELRVSERDILDGAALAAAELPEHTEGDAPPGAYTCC